MSLNINITEVELGRIVVFSKLLIFFNTINYVA